MEKKGVELSMNVIIIAAIGLLVLVILAVLVINSGGKFQSGTNSCVTQGGTCTASCNGEDLGTMNCDSQKTCCRVFTVNQ